ncbi:MAG TPA: (5-formylfuran-3-yl)methyl phosphate synthase [Planctomycetaceae bacterium]|nr:(5-formylfuran-3-yl)methyl phosphate synthase [Planctomycetaceae bacterium]
MPGVERRESRTHSSPSLRSTRLLVSVRNAVEARAAIAGGADVIDVKEPTAGSLGRATFPAMREVAEVVQQARSIPCSVALGEISEVAAELGTLQVPPSVRWVKLGLSGCASRSDWQQQWLRIREYIAGNHEWIAVAYVDATTATSPSVRRVLAAAIETHCAGLLLDTFSKTSGTLLDSLSVDELHSITREAQAAGLLVALAGRVRREDLPALTPIQPDLIAVRSAVCRNANRTAAIDGELVANFRQAMLQSSVGDEAAVQIL